VLPALLFAFAFLDLRRVVPAVEHLRVVIFPFLDLLGVEGLRPLVAILFDF
jgi:hypothetical protein